MNVPESVETATVRVPLTKENFKFCLEVARERCEAYEGNSLDKSLTGVLGELAVCRVLRDRGHKVQGPLVIDPASAVDLVVEDITDARRRDGRYGIQVKTTIHPDWAKRGNVLTKKHALKTREHASVLVFAQAVRDPLELDLEGDPILQDVKVCLRTWVDVHETRRRDDLLRAGKFREYKATPPPWVDVSAETIGAAHGDDRVYLQKCVKLGVHVVRGFLPSLKALPLPTPVIIPTQEDSVAHIVFKVEAVNDVTLEVVMSTPINLTDPQIHEFAQNAAPMFDVARTILNDRLKQATDLSSLKFRLAAKEGGGFVATLEGPEVNHPQAVAAVVFTLKQVYTVVLGEADQTEPLSPSHIMIDQILSPADVATWAGQLLKGFLEMVDEVPDEE